MARSPPSEVEIDVVRWVVRKRRERMAGGFDRRDVYTDAKT